MSPQLACVGCGASPIPFRLPPVCDACVGVSVTRADLLSIAYRWIALDAGEWHPERHATEKAQLRADTLATIAKAEGR